MSLTSTPTIGRMVHYRISAHDVASINAKRLKEGTSGNTPGVGELYPATIVRVWNGSGVNLQVHLDGPDAYWATSRVEGDAEGQWSWPWRLSDCAVAELPSGEIVGPQVDDGIVVPGVFRAEDNK